MSANIPPEILIQLTAKQEDSGRKTKREKNYARISLEKRKQLIERVVHYRESVASASRALDIKPSTARNIVKRFTQTNGRIQPLTRGGRRHYKINDEHSRFLASLIAENDRRTLDDLRRRLLANFPDLKSVSISALGAHINEKLALKLKRPRHDLEPVVPHKQP